MTTLVLRNATVLPLDRQERLLDPGAIVVRNGIIEAVVDGDAPDGDVTLDMSGRLIMPGLVNAHTHTPMVLFRGLSEGHSLLTLEGWYNTIRVWEEVMDGEMVPPAVAVSCAEMIRTGTTCFADQYFYMDRIVPVVRQSGMRATLAYGVVELGDEQARNLAMRETETFLQSLAGDERIQGWIGPHAFFVDNTPETIALELALADRYDTGMHIHLSTTGEEDTHCFAHYGRSAVQQMKKLGILELPLMAAHCLTIPPEDFETLAAHDFTAVIAASACMRAGATAAPLRAMRDAGIRTALGTDNVANNNSYDLFNEMETLGKLMSFREGQPGAVAAREIVEMATLGGARALGLEEKIGSLEVGKSADLITLDLDNIGWGPRAGQDLYTALVYAINGLAVQDVMVEGDWLLRDTKWTTLDYKSERRKLEAAHRELRSRRQNH
ncbi:MAG: amidohydrolase family protein [Caldilineaceae bacterium]